MNPTPYIFQNAQEELEWKRLRALEDLMDGASCNRLLSAGIKAGAKCLEIGAGAGSILKWMSKTAGPGGQVTAVEMNPCFINSLASEKIKILEQDICKTILEPNYFDIAHARYLLIHIIDFKTALKNILQSLKPGGWVVLEEPDFSLAQILKGPNDLAISVECVNMAIHKMFKDKGLDSTFGSKLSSILKDFQMEGITIEQEAPESVGGSPMAKMMALSAQQLTQQYVATGEVNSQDIDNYCRFAEDPNSKAIYYATIAVKARKGA